MRRYGAKSLIFYQAWRCALYALVFVYFVGRPTPLPFLVDVAFVALVSRVVARVRPLTEAEQGEGHAVALSCLEDNRTVQIDPLSSEDGKRVAQSYSLDASVPPDASQVCTRHSFVLFGSV